MRQAVTDARATAAAASAAASQAASVIEVRGLRVERKSDDWSFAMSVPHLDVRRGQAVAVVGPSGCGKSTLLDAMSFVAVPTTVARFVLRPAPDTEIDIAADLGAERADALAEVRGKHVGYVLQQGGLLPFVDVRANIELPRRFMGLPDDGTTADLAEELGIAHHLSKMPSELSVGERQRAAICRALSHGPSIVYADEPTAALDEENADRVMRLFLALAAARGVAAVIATHDRARVERYGLPALSRRTTSDARARRTQTEFTT